MTDTQNLEHNESPVAQPAVSIQPLRSSEKVDALATALARAQGMMKHPGKNKTAKVPMKAGGTYSYNYADLADVLDALRTPFAVNELAVVQVPFNEPGAVGIVTRIMHSSGQWIEGTLYMPCADGKPQTIGSAITYGRRYAISPMSGIASDDDDDGSAAQGITAQTERKKKDVGTNSAPENDHNDRLIKMLTRFADLGLSKEDVEERQQKYVATFTDADFASLKTFYDDLKKGTSQAKDKATKAFGSPQKV